MNKAAGSEAFGLAAVVHPMHTGIARLAAIIHVSSKLRHQCGIPAWSLQHIISREAS